MAPPGIKSQYYDSEDEINYGPKYFRHMKGVMELATADTFHPKLLSLSLGHGHEAFTYHFDGYIDSTEYEKDGIYIPGNQLEEITSRIGHLDLISTDISIFQIAAEQKWRAHFNSMINLHSLTFTCIPSEMDDFQCLIDIFLRSADLPNLCCLHIKGTAAGPAPIDSEALLNFLTYHPKITAFSLENVIPMDGDGAEGIAKNMTSLIHELRRKRRVLQTVSISYAPYVGDFLSRKRCRKPKKGSSTLNKCFCRVCISRSLSWLEQVLDVRFRDGCWEYGWLVWEAGMQWVPEIEMVYC